MDLDKEIKAIEETTKKEIERANELYNMGRLQTETLVLILRELQILNKKIDEGHTT